MASAIVDPLLAASEGPRSPTSQQEMELFYEEQERQDTQRRLSRRSSRTKSWRRSLIGRPGSSKNINTTSARHAKAASEADSDAYGTVQEEVSSNPRSPSPTFADPGPGPSSFRPPATITTPASTAPPTPGWEPGPGVGVFANSHRKPVPGRASTLTSPTGSQMSLPTHAPPAHYLRDQSHIPWHLRKYEIYQPPAIGARAPPRYYNYHLLSTHARERLERANAQGLGGRVPMIPSLTGSMFSGVGSGMGMGSSARSSLAGRRPSLLGALSPIGGSAGIAGLETITASPASTAAPLNSPSLDLSNALNSGPAASHRLSTLLKRPPASPHTFSQPLPTDATDLMDGTDPFGSMWHHSSPYDVGEIVVSRGFGRGKDTGSPDTATPHSRPSMLSPIATSSSVPKKGPSPLSQSTSAINLTDPEPPLPEPPGSPDLLSSTRIKRKLSKRRSSSGNGRSGFSALFGRKQSMDDDGTGDPRGGLRGRSRPPLSPSSLSLAQSQTQGITFPSSPVDGEKRTRRKLSKRGRSGSMSSAASMDSGMQSLETPIHAQFSQVLDDAGREIMIEELPSAKQEQPRARQQPQQPQQHARPPPQQQPSQPQHARPPSQQHVRPPSQQHQTSYEPPMSAPSTTHAMPIPPTPAPVPASAPPITKPPRERKISAASINSFLSRITSRDKDKDRDRDRDEKHPPRAASAQETDRKIAPHMLLNHVGPGGKRSKAGVFGRLARKLSLIRRRSVDVIGTNGEAQADERLDAALRPLNGRPSFQVERPRKDTGGGRSSGAAQPMLQRRATLDLGAGPSASAATQQFPRVSPEPQVQGYGQAQLHLQHTNGTDELFAPIDPQLRSSQLIKAAFSPPPRIPDLAIAADRQSWASLHRHVSNARPPKSEVGAAEEVRPHPIASASTPALAATLAGGKSNPNLVTEDLQPPPPLNGSRHPDSPHSIPKWGIANGAPRGPGLIMNGSPTDDSPLSLPRTMLTVANPDLVDSEAESTSPGKSAEAAERRNRALPPNPPVSPPPLPTQEPPMKRESVKPLVVKKDRSRTPSPVKLGVPVSGRESPTKRSGRESPTKKNGRERGRDREPRREHSPVKPVRRSEPLKDHSSMNGDPQKPRVPFEALRNGEDVHIGSPAGGSLRMSMMANGSTTSVDAIQGDDDVEFGAKEKVRGLGASPGVLLTFAMSQDANGRVLRRSRASMDSIGKIHVITPKTSLQKIRVRVMSNPAPIEVTKESSPVKEDAPDLLVASPVPMDATGPVAAVDSRPSSIADPLTRPTRSKSRPRSGYTGGESRHSIYGTASSVSVEEYSEDAGSPRSSVMGPRPRIPIAESEKPLAPPVIPARSGSRASPHMTPDMRTQMQSKLADPNGVTPYMTPTDEHGPLHPFSEKPIEYRNLMPSIAPISVMRVETAMPPLKGDAFSKLRASPENLKGAFIDPPFDLPPPKAPFMNEAFSVSKEKLAAQSEFKKASQSHKRESTAESERDRRRVERDEERVRARERAERVERHERDRAERAERDRADRAERERLEREHVERERAEQERIEQERAERERTQRAEKERVDRERAEWERAVERARAEQARAEQTRAEQERLERERVEEQHRLERERLRAEKEQAERERQERHRLAQLKKEQEREREREQQRIKDLERQAREREFERLEKERLERERLEREQERIERERIERIRAEQERLEWEHQEYERLERERLEEELRQRERENSQPPPLIHSRQGSGGGSRRRHEYDGEREVHVVTMKEARKTSKRRGTPGQSRSTSPTPTLPPPPPPKDDRMFKTRQRSRTDTSSHNIPNTVSPPPSQPTIEVIGGVPVLPQGTHIEVAPTYARASSEEATDLSTLKAREAWERERLDKGQSVLGPGVQRAVIPDPSSPRPTPDPRQRPPTSNSRSQTTPNPISHTEPYVLPPVQIHSSASTNMLASEYGPTHTSYAHPSYPQPVPPSRSHNPLPKPPTISGPVPLHSRPGPAYANPNRQRPSASRNPLPVPPRVSPYPMHHNVSPPRGHPPGAVDARTPGRWETMPS